MASSSLSALLISERFVSVLLLVFSLQNNAQNAGKVKWGFWHEAFVASGGPIFSLAREKIGEKRVRGDAGCFLRLHSDKNQYVRLAFHSGVTSRMSDYAPPDTVGIKFVISCCRISAINRRCSLNLSGCTFLREGVLCLLRPCRMHAQWLPL